MKGKLRTLLVWGALVAVLALLLVQNREQGAAYWEDWTVFEADLDAGRVREVQIDNNVLTVALYGQEDRYATLGVADEQLQHRLSDAGVVYRFGPRRGLLDGWLMPLLLISVGLLAVLLFLKRLGGAGGQPSVMSLRRSRARRIPETSAITFEDVGGLEEAKQRLRDVIDFLKNPDRWKGAGVRLPRAVLLEGPPGCGKTLLARAVAGEAGVPFFFVSASEFVEMFVGVGAARVRDMFENAARAAPAVVFIDELDAVGRRRGSGIGAGHDEREQTLNQLLVCLDGIETHGQVVVLAATNRADILDRALTRPGRFDARIAIPEPDAAQRERILAVHVRGKNLAPDVSLPGLAAVTAGMHGADLESLVNEAGLRAVRRVRDQGGEVQITRADVDDALQMARRRETRFHALDHTLIESASQLAQPLGPAAVRVTLEGGHDVEGDLLWADASLLKLRSAGGEELVVSKHQVRRLVVLAEGENGAGPASAMDSTRPGDDAVSF